MADHLTREQRSRAMRRVMLKNGPLERVVQRKLRELGIRFRCQGVNLPGTPDIVLAKEKIAIFVNGDFWHGYRLPQWEGKLTPFWRAKLHANRRRDRRDACKLRVLGWKVIRIWEHELKRNRASYVERVLSARRSVRGGGGR
jgi:DNA mismatch endonuclease (patch repair protein)